MENIRTKNALRNMAFGALNRIVSIFFPFIVRTIFIKSIGEEYLGLNTLYSSILQVLNLMDLGFANAIIASMYKPIADKDTERICALTKLYRDIYKVIGIAILIVGLVITPYVEYFIKGTPPDKINIHILWLFYLVNTVVSYLLFAYKVSLLNAHQRNDITEKIGALTRVIISIAQIYVVAVLKNIYFYVGLTILCSIIYNLWCSYACDKLFPQYICKGTIDKDTKTNIIKNISALTVQKIGNTISLSLDSIIISAYLGLTTVAIYGNYYYVISAISAFLSLIYSAITATIGNSIAVETRNKNYIDLKKIFFLNTWIIGWCSICFMCLFQDFMVVWMGENLLFSISTVFTLVLRFFFEQLRKVVLTYKDAAGMWWYDKWKPLVGCTVNLILNIICVKTIGVSGVAISTIISYIFVEIPWETHVLFKNYFIRSEIEYYKELMISVVGLFGVGMLTYLICEGILMHGIMGITVKLGICIVFPNILYFAINTKNSFFLLGRDLIFKILNIILQTIKSIKN